jgi:hypothetical protein
MIFQLYLIRSIFLNNELINQNGFINVAIASDKDTEHTHFWPISDMFLISIYKGIIIKN